MNSETEVARSPLDTPLLALALGVLVGGIGAFYYFDPLPAAVRWLIMLASVAMAGGVAYLTTVGKALFAFVRGSNVELRRVVWPNRKETLQTTLIIMVVVLVLAVLLWGVDGVLLWGVRLLTGSEV
ncbi:MAG: preprotein translocase subunit SecE [Nevskiales bacterium]